MFHGLINIATTKEMATYIATTRQRDKETAKAHRVCVTQSLCWVLNGFKRRYTKLIY